MEPDDMDLPDDERDDADTLSEEAMQAMEGETEIDWQ